MLQAEGTDGAGLQFETAMQTLLCIAEPSSPNTIVFPKQQFPGESMILGGFPPSQIREGSREKGSSLVGAVQATKQQGEREEKCFFIFVWE